jgi:hypothetical protein
MAQIDRYAGKPFLRLLDCYLLACIDQLDAKQDHALIGMEQKLQAIYGVPGDWRSIVSVVMDFPATMRDDVRQVWSDYLAHAKQRDASVNPNEFVEEFVRQNFPNI